MQETTRVPRLCNHHFSVTMMRPRPLDAPGQRDEYRRQIVQDLAYISWRQCARRVLFSLFLATACVGGTRSCTYFPFEQPCAGIANNSLLRPGHFCPSCASDFVAAEAPAAKKLQLLQRPPPPRQRKLSILLLVETANTPRRKGSN